MHLLVVHPRLLQGHTESEARFDHNKQWYKCTLETVEQKVLDKVEAAGITITAKQLEDLRSTFSGPSSNPFKD